MSTEITFNFDHSHTNLVILVYRALHIVHAVNSSGHIRLLYPYIPGFFLILKFLLNL